MNKVTVDGKAYDLAKMLVPAAELPAKLEDSRNALAQAQPVSDMDFLFPPGDTMKFS